MQLSYFLPWESTGVSDDPTCLGASPESKTWREWQPLCTPEGWPQIEQPGQAGARGLCRQDLALLSEGSLAPTLVLAVRTCKPPCSKAQTLSANPPGRSWAPGKAVALWTGIPAKNHSNLLKRRDQTGRAAVTFQEWETGTVPITPRDIRLQAIKSPPSALLSVGTGSFGLPQLGVC